MRKVTGLLCLSLAMLLLVSFGCSTAKKPEPAPKPQTIVVPDVSRISFETIDFDKAPEIVQSLARTLKDSHFATWTTVDNRNYVVVSQKNLPAGNGIQVTEIERRIPANDFDWVNVKLRYLAAANLPTEKKIDTEKPLVVAFTVDRPVKALGFEIEKEKAPAPITAPITPAKPAPPQGGTSQPAEKGLKLDSPKPGQQVKGPLQVSGTANGIQGTVRVRLKDVTGSTLAEKPVSIQNGKFNTTISFSSPVKEEKASVEAFVVGEGGVEKDMISVPVTLLPSTSTEPETVGAP